MVTLHVCEVITNFTQTLSEKRKDPYACKYVPKPNLVLVKRANQYINRNIAENGVKMEKSVENDNTDLALSTILFTPRRIKTTQTYRMERFEKFKEENKFSDEYATKQFTDLELKKHELAQKRESDQRLIKQADESRKRKWAVKL